MASCKMSFSNEHLISSADSFSRETVNGLTFADCGCSSNNCLREFGFDGFNRKLGYDTIYHCRSTVAYMKKEEKLSYLKPKVIGTL